MTVDEQQLRLALNHLFQSSRSNELYRPCWNCWTAMLLCLGGRNATVLVIAMYAHQQSVARSRRGSGKIHAGWILTDGETAADDVPRNSDNPHHRKASYPRLAART